MQAHYPAATVTICSNCVSVRVLEKCIQNQFPFMRRTKLMCAFTYWLLRAHIFVLSLSSYHFGLSPILFSFFFGVVVVVAFISRAIHTRILSRQFQFITLWIYLANCITTIHKTKMWSTGKSFMCHALIYRFFPSDTSTWLNWCTHARVATIPQHFARIWKALERGAVQLSFWFSCCYF